MHEVCILLYFLSFSIEMPLISIARPPQIKENSQVLKEEAFPEDDDGYWTTEFDTNERPQKYEECRAGFDSTKSKVFPPRNIASNHGKIYDRTLFSELDCLWLQVAARLRGLMLAKRARRMGMGMRMRWMGIRMLCEERCQKGCAEKDGHFEWRHSDIQFKCEVSIQTSLRGHLNGTLSGHMEEIWVCSMWQKIGLRGRFDWTRRRDQAASIATSSKTLRSMSHNCSTSSKWRTTTSWRWSPRRDWRA